MLRYNDDDIILFTRLQMSSLLKLSRALLNAQANAARVAPVFVRSYTPFNPPERKAEDLKTKRNRLLYESRKRGNLENGIILAWVI